jgi:DNA repair photolyase
MYRSKIEIYQTPAQIAQQRAFEINSFNQQKKINNINLAKEKAKRNMPKILKTVLAKIEKASKKGEYHIEYTGPWFDIFNIWNEASCILLLGILTRMGFNCDNQWYNPFVEKKLLIAWNKS